MDNLEPNFSESNFSESNFSESNGTANRGKPLAAIRINRRFFHETDSLYCALKYAENHQTSLGDVPDAVLEVFRHFYAPFGMRELGVYSEEIMQSTVRAISFLEGQLRYLKDLYESEKNTQLGSKNLSQPSSSNIPNHSNGHSNGHSSNLSSEDPNTTGMDMYQMFDDQ